MRKRLATAGSSSLAREQLDVTIRIQQQDEELSI
jgi:hypothetical protein